MLDKKNKKYLPVVDPGFQVRGEGGGLKILFEVFRVKNQDFMSKNHMFSNFRGWGGARAGCTPHGSAPAYIHIEGGVDIFSFVHLCCSDVYFSKPVTCKNQKY
jgi:hypothetical protein